MGSSKKVGNMDGEREGFWRSKLNQWRESGKTQAEFCREQGFSANTFSSWKGVIARRDDEARRAARSARVSMKTAEKQGDPAESVPAFLRFSVSDVAENQDSANERPPRAQATQAPSIAAELIDASSGRRVRIFNGADQPTVAAVLSALSANSIGF